METKTTEGVFKRSDGSKTVHFVGGDVVTYRSDLNFYRRPDGKKAWVTKRSMLFVDGPGAREFQLK